MDVDSGVINSLFFPKFKIVDIEPVPVHFLWYLLYWHIHLGIFKKEDFCNLNL